jgi:capsular polysaccharide biosynthesis protein
MQPRPAAAPVEAVSETVAVAAVDIRRPVSPLLRPVLWVVVASLVIGLMMAGIGYAAAMRPKPVYESYTILELHNQDLFKDPGPGTIQKLNNLRRRYAALLPTEPIVGPVTDALDLPRNRVNRSVRAAVTGDALLMYPTAKWGNEETAEELAQKITEQLISFAVNEQNADKVDVADRVELRIVQSASSARKVSPTKKRASTSAILLGVVGGLGAYVVLQQVAWRRRRV